MTPRMRYLTGLMVVATVVTLSIGATRRTGPDLARGEEYYGDVCSPCHGAQGAGDGPVAALLRVKPRDFVRAQFKFRSTASGQLPLDEDLFRTISGGLPNTAMPPFGEMNPEIIADIIAYIKTLSPRWSDKSEFPLDTVHVGTPVAMTGESVRRGRTAYVKAKCWECHGMQGRGDGPSVDAQFDDKKDRLYTNDLTHLWESKVGRTPEGVFKIFTTGLNGTTMPSYKDALTEQERWDLSNYVIALGESRKPYDAMVLPNDDEDEPNKK